MFSSFSFNLTVGRLAKPGLGGTWTALFDKKFPNVLTLTLLEQFLLRQLLFDLSDIFRVGTTAGTGCIVKLCEFYRTLYNCWFSLHVAKFAFYKSGAIWNAGS